MKHIEFGWQGQAGQKIYAQEWQPDGKPLGVVVLIHGIGEHTGRYQHVAARFAQAGYATVGFDLPGHGRSEGLRGHTSFREIMAEVDRLLKKTADRFPGTPLFLYGHSLGGELALYYALKRRPNLNGAIITAPALGAEVPGWKFALAKFMAVVNPSFRLSNGLDRGNISCDPDVISAYVNDPLVHDRVSASLGLDLLSTGQKILDQASEFPIPLLLMQGEKDHLVLLPKTEAFARRVPPEKLTYQVWAGLCHEIHNEPEQEQVFQRMIDWLNQHI